MRRTLRPLITIGLGCILALFSAALTYSAPPAMQATSTPPPQDLSEIGSTDGIVFMGILIAFIIIVPILLQRKSWMES
jgi:hypothetical protein